MFCEEKKLMLMDYKSAESIAFDDAEFYDFVYNEDINLDFNKLKFIDVTHPKIMILYFTEEKTLYYAQKNDSQGIYNIRQYFFYDTPKYCIKNN